MEESPYYSVQKSEVYASLMVLKNFKELLNIVTDLQYGKGVLHIETTEFISDDT